MIHTLASPATAFTPRPAASAAQAPPQPPQPPQPPADEVDLTTIDSPAKVAQLPIFEPTFQLGLAGAVAVAIFSAFGGGQAPSLNLAVTSLIGENNVLGVNYAVDLENQQSPLSAEGTVFSLQGQEPKMAPISGKIAFDQAAEQVVWNGQIGDAVETLTFRATEDQQNPGLNMSGSVGGVPVDINFSILGDINQGQEGVEGYKLSGTIGDLAYETENRYQLRDDFENMPEPKIGEAFEIGSLTTRGHLGDREISKDYTVSGLLNSETSASLTASGSGTNAGLAQTVESTLTVGDLPPGIVPASRE